MVAPSAAFVVSTKLSRSLQKKNVGIDTNRRAMRCRVPPSRRAGRTVTASGWILLSKTVGYLTLAGSLLYKLPQVARVARVRRGQGISMSGLSLETIGISLSGAYSLRNQFPFSTFGESLFIPVQNVLIMGQVVYYEKMKALPYVLFGSLFTAVWIYLLAPQVPMSFVAALNVCATPIMYFSKFPQLAMNFQMKSTGELAPITLFLQLLGNVARIFTTIVQVRDPIVMLGFVSAFFLNGALFLQWWVYRKPPAASSNVAVTASD